MWISTLWLNHVKENCQVTLKYDYLTLHPLVIYPKDEENVLKNCFSIIIILSNYVNVLNSQDLSVLKINIKSKKLSSIKFELKWSFRTHDTFFL